MATAPLQERLRTRVGMTVVLAVVAFVAVLIYLPSIRNDFVWDDRPLITDNRLLQRSAPLAIFSRGFWAGTADPAEGSASAYYRPLTTLSFWLDWRIARSPWYFHLVNVLLNALAAALVTLLIWELLHSGVWAAFGGLLFACHPGHVESVAFVSGRTDLLLAVFTAAAGVALLRSLRRRDRRWLFAVPILFGLALLSKETALLFPLLVALTPLLTQQRYSGGHWLLVTACLAVAAAYAALRSAALGSALPVGPDRLALHQLLNVGNTFGLYVKMFIWPFKHQAKFPADPRFHHLIVEFVYAVVFLVSVPLAAVRRRFRASLFGYAWAVLFLLPATNIIPIGPQAAERLLYLPSAGLVLALMVLLARALAPHALPRQATALALGAVTILFAIDSVGRAGVWRDERTLFSAMVREAPEAPSAYAGLADAVHGTRPDSAVKLYNRALYFDQSYVPAHINLGIIYSQSGDHRRAIHQLRLANELRPGSVQVLTNLGLAYLNAAHLDSALALFSRAIELDAAAPEPRMGRALALALTGRAADAGPDLNAALAAEPRLREDIRSFVRSLVRSSGLALGTPPFINRAGSLLHSLGDTALAESSYLRAIELDSALVPALYNEAVLCADRGDTAVARRLAALAYRARPDLAPVRALHEALEPR